MSRKEDRGKKVAQPSKKKSKYTITEEVEPIWARRSQSLVIREPINDGRPPHRSPSPTCPPPHTAHSTACPPAHRDTTPSPSIPGVSFTEGTTSGVNPPLYTHSPRHTTAPISARSLAPSPNIHGVTMSGVNPPLYTHSPRYTTTPIYARSPAPSPNTHGVTMSGVNPPLYTHSLRHTTPSISARPPTPSPSINGVSFPGGSMSSVTPPLHTHSPEYNNTPFSARSPTLSSDPVQDVRFLELLGINGGFMPVPDVQQQQQQQQQQEQEQQQHCEQEHQSQQQERAVARLRRERRRYFEVAPTYKKKYLLKIEGDSLEPSKISAAYIREAIQAVYKKPWPVYKDLKKEVGDTVFKEFKRHCVWDPQYESDVERLFHCLASTRLSDMLYDERKNLAEDRSYRPHWIGEKDWRDLLSYWATNDKFKRRSTANKRNRASSRHACHTQGSVSGATHKRHMAKDLGRDPHIDELHRENHIIHGTDVYVDDRSYDTQAAFREEVRLFLEGSEEYSTYEELPDAIKLELWKKVSGPGTTHKWYGLGRYAPLMEHGSLFTEPSFGEGSTSNHEMLPPHMIAQIEQLTQELQARKLMEQELRDRMERDAEQYRAFQESVDRRFEELIASTSRRPGVVENSSDDSDNPNIEEDESDD